MVDIFLLGIIKDCTRSLQNTLLSHICIIFCNDWRATYFNFFIFFSVPPLDGTSRCRIRIIRTHLYALTESTSLLYAWARFPLFFRSFSHGRGQDFFLPDLIVAIVRNSIWCSCKHKAKEQNQLSMKSLQFLWWVSVSMSFKTAYHLVHFLPLSVFPQ